MNEQEQVKKILQEVANYGGCNAISPTNNMSNYIAGKTNELLNSLALSRPEQNGMTKCFVQCSRCGKQVSNAVESYLKEGLVVRAFVECGECVAKHNQEPQTYHPEKQVVCPKAREIVRHNTSGLEECVTCGTTIDNDEECFSNEEGTEFQCYGCHLREQQKACIPVPSAPASEGMLLTPKEKVDALYGKNPAGNHVELIDILLQAQLLKATPLIEYRALTKFETEIEAPLKARLKELESDIKAAEFLINIQTDKLSKAKAEERKEIGENMISRSIAGFEALPKGKESQFWKGYWQAYKDKGGDLSGLKPSEG